MAQLFSLGILAFMKHPALLIGQSIFAARYQQMQDVFVVIASGGVVHQMRQPHRTVLVDVVDTPFAVSRLVVHAFSSI